MWMILLFTYITIGFFIGLGRISKGIYGTNGPAATLLAWIVLWPLLQLLRKILDP